MKMKTIVREIPNTNEIEMFFHCAKCLEEIPGGVSPEEFQNVQIGFTRLGIQIWCKRHDCNVAHIDFQGEKHPANLEKVA